MTANLSRRGLFKAFRLPMHGTTAEDAAQAAPVDMIARINQACVEPRGVMCRRCGDECGAHAISFRLMGRGRAQASIDTELCNGCGACLPVCPTLAIQLVPAERQMLAQGLAELGRTA